jgi:ABC-type microcin C transport system duplicated ATPase subunit YejF
VVLRDGGGEGGPADRVFSAPESEYTRTLLAAAFD